MGAKTDTKNEKGLSAYDMAVRADYNSIVAMFNEPQQQQRGVRRKKASRAVAAAASATSSSSSDSDDTDDLF